MQPGSSHGSSSAHAGSMVSRGACQGPHDRRIRRWVCPLGRMPSRRSADPPLASPLSWVAAGGSLQLSRRRRGSRRRALGRARGSVGYLCARPGCARRSSLGISAHSRSLCSLPCVGMVASADAGPLLFAWLPCGGVMIAHGHARGSVGYLCAWPGCARRSSLGISAHSRPFAVCHAWARWPVLILGPCSVHGGHTGGDDRLWPCARVRWAPFAHGLAVHVDPHRAFRRTAVASLLAASWPVAALRPVVAFRPWCAGRLGGSVDRWCPFPPSLRSAPSSSTPLLLSSSPPLLLSSFPPFLLSSFWEMGQAVGCEINAGSQPTTRWDRRAGSRDRRGIAARCLVGDGPGSGL